MILREVFGFPNSFNRLIHDYSIRVFALFDNIKSANIALSLNILGANIALFEITESAN